MNNQAIQVLKSTIQKEVKTPSSRLNSSCVRRYLNGEIEVLADFTNATNAYYIPVFLNGGWQKVNREKLKLEKNKNSK